MDPRHLQADDVTRIKNQFLAQSEAAQLQAHLNYVAATGALRAVRAEIDAAAPVPLPPSRNGLPGPQPEAAREG